MMLLVAVASAAATVGVTTTAAVEATADPITDGPSATPFQTIPYFDEHFVTVEAEDFHTAGVPSWRPALWGVDPNYYCGAVFNTYMSRRGYLTAAGNATDVTPATATVAVPAAGRWQLLVRYEALTRFDTNFRVTLTQKGVKKLDAVFGLLSNLKVWAYSSPTRHFEGLNGTVCGPGLNAVCKWPWGPENQLWEGLGNASMVAHLDAGPVDIALSVDTSSVGVRDAADRNVDMFMLTQNTSDWERRMRDETRNLPGDGLLSQAGEVFVKIKNTGTARISIFIPYEVIKSPSWDHPHLTLPITTIDQGCDASVSPCDKNSNSTARLQTGCAWSSTPKIARNKSTNEVSIEVGTCGLIPVDVGYTSDWVDIGRFLDTLNHGLISVWAIDTVAGVAAPTVNTSAMSFDLTVGTLATTVHGKTSTEPQSIGEFKSELGVVQMLIDCNTRKTLRVSAPGADFEGLMVQMREQSKTLQHREHGKPKVPKHLYVKGETWSGTMQAPVCTTEDFKPKKKGQPPPPPVTTCVPLIMNTMAGLKSRHCQSYDEIITSPSYNESWMEWQGMVPTSGLIGSCVASGNATDACAPFSPGALGLADTGGSGSGGWSSLVYPFGNATSLAKLDSELAAEYPTVCTGEAAQNGTCKANASAVLYVSLGDEIHFGNPCKAGKHGAILNTTNSFFVAWARENGFADGLALGCEGKDWSSCVCNASISVVQNDPNQAMLFYHSNLAADDYANWQIGNLSAVYKRRLPNARIGANFMGIMGADCPDPNITGCNFNYVGTYRQFIKPFREGVLTLPWSEDWTWQSPLLSQQGVTLLFDVFRSGMRDDTSSVNSLNVWSGSPPIMFYVMPHLGNTPASWRRQFYGDLAHGMKLHNTFHLSTPDASYTCDSTPSIDNYSHFKAIRRAWNEVSTWDDIIMHGRAQAQGASVALLYSQTADIWSDGVGTIGAHKRAVYLALRHLQLPVDIVVEEDAVAGKLQHLNYSALYITEAHLTDQAGAAIADWVSGGGTVFATAGAGLRNQFNQTNAAMAKLLGVAESATRSSTYSSGEVHWVKDDLPFSLPLEHVHDSATGTSAMPALGRVSVFTADAATTTLATFKSGKPALVRSSVGRGHAFYAGFLPGLSYFFPAIPRRPADRGATDENMNHFVPHDFDVKARTLIGLGAKGVSPPIIASEPLVESGIITAAPPHRGSAVVLINWAAKPIYNLTVRLDFDVDFTNIHLGSGAPVAHTPAATGHGAGVFTLDLAIADAIVLR